MYLYIFHENRIIFYRNLRRQSGSVHDTGGDFDFSTYFHVTLLRIFSTKYQNLSIMKNIDLIHPVPSHRTFHSKHHASPLNVDPAV